MVPGGGYAASDIHLQQPPHLKISDMAIGLSSQAVKPAYPLRPLSREVSTAVGNGAGLIRQQRSTNLCRTTGLWADREAQIETVCARSAQAKVCAYRRVGRAFTPAVIWRCSCCPVS
jgi:hypothetical protein